MGNLNKDYSHLHPRE